MTFVKIASLVIRLSYWLVGIFVLGYIGSMLVVPSSDDQSVIAIGVAIWVLLRTLYWLIPTP
jgi:hypothetical protein